RASSIDRTEPAMISLSSITKMRMRDLGLEFRRPGKGYRYGPAQSRAAPNRLHVLQDEARMFGKHEGAVIHDIAGHEGVRARVIPHREIGVGIDIILRTEIAAAARNRRSE